MKLPAGPILAVLERAAVAQGYLGRVGDDYPGLDAFAAMRWGFQPGYIATIRHRGEVSLQLADRLAIGLGLHPILIWPAEWPVEPPEDDEEADRQARETQAHREYMRAYNRGERRPRPRSTHCGREGHRPRTAGGHCPDCSADRIRDNYRRAHGIPLDAPVSRGRKRRAA